jgi:hypothetical protein
MTTAQQVEWEEYRSLLDSAEAYADIAGPGRDVMVVARPLDEAMGHIHVQLTKTRPRQSLLCSTVAKAWEILAQSVDSAAE